MKIRERLIAYATQVKAQYPQYANFYDNYILARATRTVRYKGGAVLARGRFVIADPKLDLWFDPDTTNDCQAEKGILVKATF